ncbi:CHAT domain-containing protein [Aquabacterium sp.]|uniref:CHAT domain-containing protein n=1 Tax=Aquabacterium sp. TaxID=1872578 RepID=UPI002BE83B1D|nr:CHAT domain-containing protein [Aquabacterium sp.]HSW05621.1 CHAT domain-containing protein [Aquabacterium sp.]
MPRFEDPLGTAAMDLPAGWVFDAPASSLTRLVFVHWALAGSSLRLSLVPPRVPAEAPDAVWREELAGGLPTGTALSRLACAEGDALMADLPGPQRLRVAFVRGLRLAATLEHGGVADDAESMALLPRVLATLLLPPNRAATPDQPLSAVQALQNTASAAAVAADAIAALRQGLDIARGHWLASLVAAGRSPNLPAVETCVSLWAGMAFFCGVPTWARQADQTALRARRTLAGLPMHDALRQPIDQHWQLLRSKVVQLQAGQLQLKDPAPPLLTLLEARGRWLLQQGIASAGRKDLALAALQGEAALDDLLLKLAQLAQQQTEPRSQALVAVAGQPGVTRAALIEAYRRALAPDAAAAAQLGYRHAMDRQDARAARDAATLLCQLTALTMQDGQADPASRRAHALALMSLAGALLFAADPAALDEADRRLVEATALVEALPDDPSLIAELCRDHAWVKHYQHQAEAGAALCATGLAALDRLPQAERTDDDQRMRRAIASLHSQFLMNQGDLVQALAQARAAVDAVEQPISSNLLNLALVLDKSGRRGEALLALRRGFEQALPDNPLGQDVLRLLFVASSFLEPDDPAAALALHAAAASLRDVQRLQFAQSDHQLAFEEEAHHLEVSQTLVGRLLDSNELGAALVAADSSRARVLVELLGPDALRQAAPPLPPAPQLPADAATALPMAGAFVRDCAACWLAAHGAPMPLDVAGLVDTVAAAGRPALLIQPERGRVHLFCILPEAGVLVAQSPLPMAQVVEAMHAAQAGLGVFATARSRSGGQLVLADVDEDAVPALDAALATLSQALIYPLLALLSDNPLSARVLGPRGLIIVPYRELALVPYGLLRAPDGRQLLEHGPVLQVPSLAALAALQQRPHRAGDGCAVFGEPALAASHRLEALPAAAAEAQAVAALLAQAGVPATRITLRLGDQATEAAYRHDAADAMLVHLSCHAAVREPASQSALYLSPTPQHDGLLVPHEIADVALADALVFLSACQTGLGRPTADGVIGLGRAFLEAGARAVVLSLWRVVDAVAQPMAGHFYRALLGLDGDPVDAATALQQAMLATRADLRAGRIRSEAGELLDDHPAHWAPFMLVGDGALRLALPQRQAGDDA